MKPRDAETSLEREFDQHFDLPTIRSVTPSAHSRGSRSGYETCGQIWLRASSTAR